MLRDANHTSSDNLEHLHDVCLVWTLEIQRVAPLEGHYGQLADCFRGVLLSGSGEPDRLLSILHGAVKDHSGGDHVKFVRRLLGNVSRRIVEVESRRCVSLHYRRGLFYVFPECLTRGFITSRRIARRALRWPRGFTS